MYATTFGPFPVAPFAPHPNRTLCSLQLAFYVLFFPCMCLFAALVLGGILAAAEDWPFVDGFVLALGEVTNTGVALPNTPPPDTVGGKIVGLFVGIASAAILGIFIAIGSVPLLGYELAFIESPITRTTAFLLNSEQKEKLKAPDAHGVTPTKG